MQSDIWSLGCILYEMITLQHPFLGRNLRELYGKVSWRRCACTNMCVSIMHDKHAHAVGQQTAMISLQHEQHSCAIIYKIIEGACGLYGGCATPASSLQD